jgi:hypothetical protein
MSKELLPALKAPFIEMGKTSGYNAVENYDLGAGPIDVAWIFKPGVPELQALPDLRVGFIFLLEYSESAINHAIAKSILNLIDKLILVAATEEMTSTISQSIEKYLSKSSILQLRKYVTVLTPSTVVDKAGVLSSRGKDNSITTSGTEDV